VNPEPRTLNPEPSSNRIALTVAISCDYSSSSAPGELLCTPLSEEPWARDAEIASKNNPRVPEDPEQDHDQNAGLGVGLGLGLDGHAQCLRVA
jgi:hypothetical protein